MNRNDIKKMRMDIGKFLHNYYIKFGEKKYDEFIEKMSDKMMNTYGEVFSQDNLRIMEAEYVTFAHKIKNENKSNNSKITA